MSALQRLQENLNANTVIRVEQKLSTVVDNENICSQGNEVMNKLRLQRKRLYLSILVRHAIENHAEVTLMSSSWIVAGKEQLNIEYIFLKLLLGVTSRNCTN